MVGEETGKWLGRRLEISWEEGLKMVGKETLIWLGRRLENGW
jgi:hypothetical protein